MLRTHGIVNLFLGCLLASTISCGGGSGNGAGAANSPGGATPSPIVLNSISPSLDQPGLYVVSYTPTPGYTESISAGVTYQPEVKWPGQDWVLFSGFGYTPYIPTNNTLYIQIQTTKGAIVIPEGVTASIRVQLYLNGTLAPWAVTSNEMTQIILPTPPQLYANWDDYHDWIRTECYNESTIANQFEYQISQLDSNGNPTTWVTVSPSKTDTNPNDSSDQLIGLYPPFEEKPVACRVRALTGSLKSIWTMSTKASSGEPMVPGPAVPTDLTCSSDSSGIHLTWTNRSILGLPIQIMRTLGSVQNPNDIAQIQSLPIASLSPSTTSFIDIPETDGDFTYSIAISNGAKTYYGPSVHATTTSGLTLSYLPPDPSVGTDIFSTPEPNGNWLWSTLDSTFETSLNGSTINTGLGMPTLIQPGPIYDVSGFPHLFSHGPNYPYPLTHAWKDLNGWHSEPIGNGLFLVASQAPDGSFWLSGMTDPIDTNTIATVQLLHGITGGGWTSSTITSPSQKTVYYPFSNFDACQGTDGTLYFLFSTQIPNVGARQIVLIRGLDGTISEYQVPDLIEPSSPYSSVPVVGMVADSNGVLHLFRALSLEYHQTMKNGGFSAPETLLHPTFAGSPTTSGGASSRPFISLSGSRIAWLEKNPPRCLFLSDVSGWHYYSVSRVNEYGFFGDRLWYTTYVSDSLDPSYAFWGGAGYALFEEP
jgi:hypothetical protein